MSKRTDTIRSLFTQPPSPALSADNNAPELAPGCGWRRAVNEGDFLRHRA